MGITGLLPFLEPSSRKCYINEFRGCTVAIDSYCWLHKGAFACAEKIVRGEKTNAYITYCLKYIHLLQSYNIKPILVFDGQHLPAKKDTETKRREQRKFARAKGTELLRLGKVDEARRYFRQCVDITHEMALDLIKECRNKNIDCIVAPYEADAQLAFLNLQGIADIVITEDSDLILFGCFKILFKFNLDGSGVLIEKSNLNKAMRMHPDQYSFEKFRYMCIMSGCDYLDSLPGIGIIRAHRAISMTHDSNIYNLLPRLPRYLNLSKLVVTQEYIDNFKLADATIKHQIVYDPIKRKLRPLTDPSEADTDPQHLKNAGVIGDSERAFQMALGNIDPISNKVLDSWNPDRNSTPNVSSIWCATYKKPKFSEKSDSIPIAVKPKNMKNVEVSMSTEFFLANQQEALDYDRKLQEELEIYKNVEPTIKRTKSNEEDMTKTDGQAETSSKNPFVKKKISKFQITTLNKNEIVKSRFFASNTEKVPKIYKLVEQMDSEHTTQNDLNCSTSSQCVDACKTRTSPQLSIDSSDEYSFTQNALNQISVSNKESMDQDELEEEGPVSPILSRFQNKNLSAFKRDRINKKIFRHGSFESTLIEKITLSDEIDSAPSSIKESDGDSSDLTVEVVNEITMDQSPAEGILDNTQFIQKKKPNAQCKKVGLSKNIKKSNQPTLLDMFGRSRKN